MAEGETMVKHILRSDDASAPETAKRPPNAGRAIARIKGCIVDETGKRGRSQFLKTREYVGGSSLLEPSLDDGEIVTTP